MKRSIKRLMVVSLSIVTFTTLTGHYTNEVPGEGSYKETSKNRGHLFLPAATLWEVKSLVLTGLETTTQSKLSSEDVLLCCYKTASRASRLAAVTYLGSTAM